MLRDQVKPLRLLAIQVNEPARTPTFMDSGDTTMTRTTLRTAILGAAALLMTAQMAMAQTHTSKPFTGAKVNSGTVTHSVMGGKHVLTLSSDFQVPDTPDPHWQVVDSRGGVHLLQRLGVKSLAGVGKDRVNTSITLPDYVRDIAKVQIYCAWAEAVLGETALSVSLNTSR
jgi:hypothetical protein